jgi:hypothetical protein
MMNSDYVNVRVRNQQKKSRLKVIVQALGENATSEDIRRSAYESGFGVVNAALLVRVRNELYPSRSKRNGGRPFGSKCDEVYGLSEDTGQVHIRRRAAASQTHKRCTVCNEEKPVTQFGLRAGDKILRRSHCRKCSSVKRAEAASRSLKDEYGITADEYDQLLKNQNGGCAICGKCENHKNMKHRELCIDHSHNSGHVRGLLCSKCNLGIGHFFDNYDLLLKAAEYIRGS